MKLSFVKILLFAAGAYLIFSCLVIILKLITHQPSDAGNFLGFFSKSDLFMGLIVAGVVTLSYIRRQKFKNNNH